MKPLFASFLILAVALLAVAETASPVASATMTSTEMSAAIGAGFWGGALCGAAITGVGIGLAAAIVTTGGAAVVWTIAIGTSVAAHVGAVCVFLD
jgi:hypothetical protein